MRNCILLLMVIAFAAGACRQAVPDKANTREMFNAGGLKVIAHFANRRAGTMSVLYGNEAARKAALTGYTTHYPGEVFALAVHRQADNKFWYGSYINGALLSAETVRNNAEAGMPARLSYHLDQGHAPADSAGNVIAVEKRIAYILSHQPAVFP